MHKIFKKKILALFCTALIFTIGLGFRVNSQPNENSAAAQAQCQLPSLDNASISLDSGQPAQVSLGESLRLSLVADSGTADNPEVPDEVPDTFNPSQYILFLDGYPLPGVHGKVLHMQDPAAPANQGENGNTTQLEFDLIRNSENQETWSKLLSRSTNLELGLGCLESGAIALSSTQEIELNRLDLLRFIVCIFPLVLMLFLLINFGMYFLRDITPPMPEELREALKEKDYMPPFSLARTQMLIWFLAVVFCYGYIFIGTGRFTGILTHQSIVLIGLTSVTGLGGFLIDQNNIDQENIMQGDVDPSHTLKKIIWSDEIGSTNEEKADELLKILPAASRLDVSRWKLGCLGTLYGWIRSFFKDILVDLEGNSLYRYQMLIWTVILASIFVYEVLSQHQFPEFDDVLLWLQGISSGTYIGFKLREPPKSLKPQTESGSDAATSGQPNPAPDAADQPNPAPEVSAME